MARYTTTVTTTWTVEQAFAYMADLTNFAAWDPGVTTAVALGGSGQGAEFDVTVKTPGRDTTLRYRIVEFDANRSLRAVAENGVLRSDDRITVEADGAGARVTYDAELTLKGVLRLADPLLRLSFDRIGDRASDGLRRVLAGVPA